MHPYHQLDLITILSMGANRVLCWRKERRVRNEKIEITGRGPRHPLYALEAMNGAPGPVSLPQLPLIHPAEPYTHTLRTQHRVL